MRVLMVGLGGIGQRHVRNLRGLLGSQLEIMAYRRRNLSAVITDQLQAIERLDLEKHFDIRVYHDLGAALDQRPDAVFVCNPTSLHLPVALAAAEAGCHLFIEKPVSHDYQDVDCLVREIDSRNLISLVGFQMRFHPCLQRARTLLRERAIGRILAVRAEIGEYLPAWHSYEDYRQMYASKRELGGGVILSQIHELDYLYWLFGLPKRVFAIGGHLSSLEVDVEDVASIMLEDESEGHVLPVHVHEDYVQRPASRTCQIIGDEGKILLDLRASRLDVFDRGGELAESVVLEGFQRNQLFVDEVKHFLTCIRVGRQSLVPVREGAQSLRIAVAAKESLATGRVVELGGE